MEGDSTTQIYTSVTDTWADKTSSEKWYIA